MLGHTFKRKRFHEHKVRIMKKQNITIKEVARLAKTSRGTVDRVINNRGSVNSEVAKRVMDVIKETGYEKSFIAKRLSSDRDLNVGVIVGTINNSFFQDVLTGIRNGINRYYDYGLKARLFSLLREKLSAGDTEIWQRGPAFQSAYRRSAPM